MRKSTTRFSTSNRAGRRPRSAKVSNRADDATAGLPNSFFILGPPAFSEEMEHTSRGDRLETGFGLPGKEADLSCADSPAIRKGTVMSFVSGSRNSSDTETLNWFLTCKSIF